MDQKLVKTAETFDKSVAATRPRPARPPRGIAPIVALRAHNEGAAYSAVKRFKQRRQIAGQ
jgi:hypothetical protein